MGELKYTSLGALLADANCVAYYRFNNGALLTDSKGSRTLTNVGTVAGAAGNFEECADFGTANSTKQLYNSSDNYGIDGGAVSISFWIKMRTEIASGGVKIIDLRSPVSSKTLVRCIYDYNAGTRRLDFNRLRMNVANQDIYYTVTLGTSVWHHIVIDYDATNARIYFDGALVSGPTAMSGNGSDGTGYTLGLDISEDRALNAYIDDVAIFNRALTLAEVQALYADIPASTNTLTNYRARKRTGGAVSV